MACGLLDDFRPLPAFAKLGLQVLVVAGVFTPLLAPELRGHLPYLALAWLALLYFVNAWNFMDGSNGMIPLQSLVIALAVGTWPGQDPGVALAALALAAACLGYLPLNLPRARVFLGDAGSLLLGAAVFALLAASCTGGVMSLLQALLLASVVLLDTALTLARRVVAGKPFWRAHREHLYQYAIRVGHSHAKVAFAYAGATGVAWLLALTLQGRVSTTLTIAVPTLAWGGGMAAYVLLRRHWLGRRRQAMGVQG
jgi:UDP-N-acetylmuramyl pentapeptide phosphotransferase/UDP-N-acetylglucosamine-1-phosphate transferase